MLILYERGQFSKMFDKFLKLNCTQKKPHLKKPSIVTIVNIINIITLKCFLPLNNKHNHKLLILTFFTRKFWKYIDLTTFIFQNIHLLTNTLYMFKLFLIFFGARKLCKEFTGRKHHLQHYLLL